MKEVLDEVVALHHELLHAEPALVSLLNPQVPYPELLVVAAEGGRRDHDLSIVLNALAPLDESEAGPLLQTILLLQELLEFQREFQGFASMVADFVHDLKAILLVALEEVADGGVLGSDFRCDCLDRHARILMDI